MWNKLKLPSRRTAFVQLFINDQLYGLYTNLEEMDNDWLSRNFRNGTGNLFKCTYPADLVYLGDDQQLYKDLNNSTATGGRVYELETNEDEDNYIRLAQLIKNIHEANGPMAEQKINEVLNVDLFIKAMAIDAATGNWDNYGFNKNNFYLYQNPTTNTFDFIAYDTDNTFGVDWINIDWTTRSVINWIHPTDPRPLAAKVLQVPVFSHRYYQFLDSISKFVFHPFYIFPKIDSMRAFIRNAAIADTFRTLDYGYDIQAFDLGFTGTVDAHTPYGIKPFLTNRSPNTVRELIIPLTINESVFESNPIFINPFSDFMT
jgi:hypothetical protein